MWRIYKAAGRPWPVFCEDDVIDYMVMETVAVEVIKQDRQAEKKKKIDEWKKSKDGLDHLREVAG